MEAGSVRRCSGSRGSLWCRSCHGYVRRMSRPDALPQPVAHVRSGLVRHPMFEGSDVGTKSPPAVEGAAPRARCGTRAPTVGGPFAGRNIVQGWTSTAFEVRTDDRGVTLSQVAANIVK